MSNPRFPYAFRICGSLDSPRKRVDAHVALTAYRQCDMRARVGEEAYLSHFRYGEDFREHLAQEGSPRGFVGPTWAEEVIFDIDRENDLAGALDAARQLVSTLETQFGVPPTGMHRHFSGHKGFHIALPSGLWLATGGPLFHRIAGVFAAMIAAEAGIDIDVSVYDRVRAMRAPNSRHPKTGLHRRLLPADRFGDMCPNEILSLAREPFAFEGVNCSNMPIVDRLAWVWEVAKRTVSQQVTAANDRRTEVAAGRAKPALNRLTLDIIRGEPIAIGDRHRLIYSAARDLAEKGATRALVDALLREPALDTGLPPKDVDRQLDCGFHDAVSPTPDVAGCTSTADDASSSDELRTSGEGIR